MEDVKDLIRELIESRLKFESLYRNLPIKISTSRQPITIDILLYGPSGCGKTFIGQSVAKEMRMNTISVKGPELLNKYIGASEHAVRDTFERAQNMKPCIVLFDEFDAIVPKRTAGSVSVTDRVVNQ